MSSTALVTGATGFLGGHLVRQLISRGVRVRALVRKPMAASDLVVAGAEVIRGDLLEPASLKAAFDVPVDWVFHVAADTSVWRGHNERQNRINIEGTSNLLAAARNRAQRFIHTSSVAVFGLTEDLIREDSPKLGAQSWINYARSKTLAELKVLEFGERGLDVVVLNPTHIIGPMDRHNWARLIQLVDRETLPGVPPGIGCFADVREVAKAHIRAAEVGRSGQNYLLGGVHASFLEFVGTAAGLLGRRSYNKTTSAWMLGLVARWRDLRSVQRAVEPELTPEAAAFSCHRMRVDSSKAERELDLRTPSLLPMLKDSIDWLRDNHLLKSV
jgi:nucleoside-diphosphate-sugar epimerase